MLAKLFALLKGTRPESTEFDYTRQHWGHEGVKERWIDLDEVSKWARQNRQNSRVV